MGNFIDKGNDGFYRMYGYTRKQFDDEVKFINDLIYEEDRERVEATVTAIVKPKKSEQNKN